MRPKVNILILISHRTKEGVSIKQKNEKVKSITSLQRQVFNLKGISRGAKVNNRYRLINPNPQNVTFENHMDSYSKCENLITERLEKSNKIDTIIKKNFGH